MLVLSRKLNEKVVIGDSVVITIVDVGNGRVRIGIEAPRDVPVNRLEVLEALAARASFADTDAIANEPAKLEPVTSCAGTVARPAPLRAARRRNLAGSSL